MIFGGSGGQDFFQKTTWALGALFMGGSLALALMKSSSIRTSRYLNREPQAQTAPMPEATPAPAAQQPEQPAQAPAPQPTAQ